jgi:hypothetical protein
MTFPVEAVPDGRVLAPHHFYALGVTVLAALVVWDDFPRREPVTAFVGAAGGSLAFALVWPLYPATGAVLSALGLLAAVCSPLVAWTCYPVRWRVVAVVGALVAADDWISHALGVWTPLDWFWHAYLLQVVV